MSWFDDLESDLAFRFPDSTEWSSYVKALLEGLNRIRPKLNPSLIHAIDYEDRRIAFLIIEGDEVSLIRLDPPDMTRVSFIGSLAGGSYQEVAHTGEKPVLVEGLYDHDRLGDDGPLRVILEPPVAARMTPAFESAVK